METHELVALAIIALCGIRLVYLMALNDKKQEQQRIDFEV